MTVKSNIISSMLVTRDGRLRTALSYLFAVLLKHDFEAVESGKAARASLSNGGPRDVVFVHVSGHCSQAIDLIVFAKSLKPAPLVIALQSGGSELGTQAFFAGADDVVVWPHNLRELSVRLSVRLGYPLDQKSLPVDDFSWETEAFIAERAGLTTAEAQIMRVLYKHDGEIVSRDDLSLALDARPWRYGDRKFDVHVAKIRKKLLESFGAQVSVTTIRSSGYCLVTEGFDSHQ